jgi:hypothetical protein
LDSVKKIVKLTPKQYEELLRNGQVEVNGVIKTKEDGVLYDVGELHLLEWFNELMEAQVTEYKVNHTPMAMKSLEQEYEELTANEGQESSGSSAVGYTAILKKWDKIIVKSPNKGTFYINGSKVTENYTYTGSGVEAVNVWVFETTDEGVELNDESGFDVVELHVKNIGVHIPKVSNGYKKYAQTIKTEKFVISGSATRRLFDYGGGTFNQANISGAIEEIESDCVNYPTQSANGYLYNKTHLIKANFPKLEIIQTNSNGFLSACNNEALVINFPRLRSISGAGVGIFNNVVNIILPKSVEVIGNAIFAKNKSIVLECNNATISSGWCIDTLYETKLTLADDWKSTVNLAKAGQYLNVEWFITFFNEKLHDFSEDETKPTKVITVPTAIFNELKADYQDVLAEVEYKGWTVGGA